MPPRKTVLPSIILSMGFLLANHASGAVITWTSGSLSAGDTIVSTTGSLVEAANFGGSGVADVTVNTVAFVGVDFTGSGSLTNLSGLTYNNAQSGNGTSTGGSIDTLTNFVAYQSNTTNQSAQLTGLSIGTQYIVQFFVNHPGTSGRSSTINDGNGNTVSISHAGEYATGSFTADASTQALTFQLSQNGSQLLSGYQLRSIPEPSVMLLGSLGLLALLRRRRD